ncbi:MAG: Rieske 2Fe-2S domain-containing protein [Burkholderiales bacterium]|nr:Rieske 2Fe-2S domain-containing protein [Burkholderiales bacterium]
MGTELEHLIIDDRERGVFRVNRHVFLNQEILEQERRAIFSRCWLYAGHESELSKPGDYLTRRVGGRPLLLTRDADNTLRVFLNVCTHRGNLVCREKKGNARSFTCFYHAWAFSANGDLIGLPGEGSYTEAFDRKSMGLTPVPRFESYRGLLFVCFDPNAVDLATYLGEAARDQIDFIIDSGGTDGVEIVQGAQSYSMKANWKLLVENSIDGYHGLPTHQRFFRNYITDMGMEPVVRSVTMTNTEGISLGNGHAVTEKPKHLTALSGKEAEALAAQRAEIERKFGKERAHQIADFDRNVFIFPNLILISTWRTLRTFYPASTDFIEVDAWGLMPVGESPELRQKRFENFISFLGPAGFGTPDDVVALENCQRAFAAVNEQPWSDISRGMHREKPTHTDELQMRAFWRRWLAVMQGRSGPTNCSDRPEQTAQAEPLAMR